MVSRSVDMAVLDCFCVAQSNCSYSAEYDSNAKVNGCVGAVNRESKILLVVEEEEMSGRHYRRHSWGMPGCSQKLEVQDKELG